MAGETDLESLLVEHEARLRGFLEKEGAGLLRWETVDDLAQGVTLRALEEEERFEYRGAREFTGWLFTVARRYVADRNDYWSAIRRGSGKVLRLTWSDSSSGGDPFAKMTPPGTQPGPSTFADRREMLVLAAKAAHRLPPRDRKLVRWMSEGVPIEEQAERLGMSYAAAQRAGHRALDRFRKVFRLITSRGEE